jgi:hypothetical protein
MHLVHRLIVVLSRHDTAAALGGGIAMAIAQVAVPPKRGIYYGQVCLV